jgi:hypothetical protein
MNTTAEVRIRRQGREQNCDVVVAVGGRQMVITLPDYDLALRWAQLECKSYGIPPALPIVEIFDAVPDERELERL